MKNKITLQEKLNVVVKNLPGSGYKMGDKFTLTVGLLTATHDTREYYSGRGAKYNSSIRHGSINIIMTERELNKAYKPIIESLKLKRQSELRMKKYIANCNKPEYILEAVKKAVDVIEDMPATEGDSRYYINGYHGCGVYRLVIKNGKIIATIKGGFYDSCPYGVDKDKWFDGVLNYINARFIDDYKIVKADGSGCQFFLRYEEDASLLKVKEYNVPAPNGDGSMGYVHRNIQVACE